MLTFALTFATTFVLTFALFAYLLLPLFYLPFLSVRSLFNAVFRNHFYRHFCCHFSTVYRPLTFSLLHLYFTRLFLGFVLGSFSRYLTLIKEKHPCIQECFFRCKLIIFRQFLDCSACALN